MLTNDFSPFDFFFCCSHLSKNMRRRSRGVWVREFSLSIPDKSGCVHFTVKHKGDLHEFFAKIQNDKVIILDLYEGYTRTNGYPSTYKNELEKCQQFVYFLSSLVEWPDAAEEAKGFLTDPTSQKNNWLKTTTVMI